MPDHLKSAWLVAALLGGMPVAAQPIPPSGIDCGKARSPTEKAICATPGLIALDRQAAAAYADAVARQPDRRVALRQAQLRWIRERDAACALPTPAIPDCLRAQFTARIAALSAAPAPVTGTEPGTPALPAASLQTDGPLPPLPDPVVPAGALPQAAARLDQTSFAAAAEAGTLLHVTVAGRFTLAAKGPGGSALQLVDMLTGPSAVAGSAGSQDGRLDTLLDVGTYKLLAFSAKGATGTVTVSATPFREIAAPAALPQPGQPLTATLRDGEQRSFWLLIPPSGIVRIEAAGRSLADLRLWRDGRTLDALEPEAAQVEPVPGHPLSRLRLVGKVEPGTYRVTAYGGPAASWTDGDAAQPFHLRAGASDALAAGWTGGTVGPFGSEVFQLPPSAATLRLRVPRPVDAALAAGDGLAKIARDSREPTATLAVTPGQQPVVEVRGAQGQAFTLRALDQPLARSFGKPGTFWVSAVANGAGGDEVPPTVLLLRNDGSAKPGLIVADDLPNVGSAPGWRAKFNLRGPTRLLARTGGGPIALRTIGVPVRGDQVGAELPEGIYAFSLAPQPGAQGALELILGPPGSNPPPAPITPPDPVVPLGIQTLGAGASLELRSGSAPGEVVGLSARPVPVALAEAPLLVTLAAGQGIDVPVKVAAGGTLLVSEVGVGPTPYGRREQAGQSLVALPPLDHPRTVALAWHRTPSAPAAILPPAAGGSASVQAGTPVFFDLGDVPRSFDLSVADGGLFRVETLGRLRTAGLLSTDFIPRLGEADANGVGQNFLIQTELRAGRYRVQATAEGSSGRAGLLATPAPLLATGPLRPGGTVRATLPAGSGAAVPLLVDSAVPVHLDVLGLGDPWQGRLEDEAGWPLTRPGKLDGVERTLQPGRHRVVVFPAPVTRQVLLRLRTVEPPVTIVGHGPHPLPFGVARAATWREPDSVSAPRTPDRWTFSLEGKADVTIALTDTMVGTLGRAGSAEAGRRVGRRFAATLGPGDWELLVTSLGRNDRAPYTIKLDAAELQPAAPRTVSLPATLPFAIAAPRVVTLTSFGATPVRAVLRDGTGQVIGRFGPRTDDWNVAVSRSLPAGAYRLELMASTAPDMVSTALRDAPAAASDDGGNGTQIGNDDAAASPQDDQAAQTADSQTGDPAPTKPAADADASGGDDAPAPTVEVRLTLPPLLDPLPAPSVAETLPGSGVHLLTLPPVPPDGLVLAQAESAAAVALVLERQDDAGWTLVASDQGGTPSVASPAGAAARWRVRAWAVDGGPDPVRLVARAVTAPAQEPGTPTLAALAGMAAPLAVARLRTTPGLLLVKDSVAGLRGGSWPGQALRLVPGGTVLPVAGETWLLGPAGPVTASSFEPADRTAVALTVPDGADVALPTAATPLVWLARSGAGQPSLGGSSGWSPGSVVALAGQGVSLQGEGGGALRVDLARLAPRMLPEAAADPVLHGFLPPGTALPVRLPDGGKRLALELAPETAAFLDWHGARTAVWAGDAAISRQVAGDWTTLLLVNTGTADAPVSLAATAAPPEPALAPGSVLKRFFGAAGSFEIALAGAEGARLHLAGPATMTTIGADGSVAQGRDLPATGPGRVLVRHGTGAVAMWMDAPGASPWPAATAQAVELPATLALSGPARAFRLSAAAPVLLHADTTAPVLLGLGRDTPDLFPTGAELHRVLPEGSTELTVLPPQDGDLTGTLRLRAEPIQPVREGLGATVAVAPGGAAAFGFVLTRAATIGVGVRAEPDRVRARLLAVDGKVMGEGVAQLVSLPAGRYVLEAEVPADAPTTLLRPAVVGITPRPSGPPPDVVHEYLELAGMKPQGSAP